MTSFPRFLAICASALLFSAVASADDRETESRPTDSNELPAPTAPGTPGSTTVVAPPGSGGVTVVAPTVGGGSVTASGCSTVVVNGSPTLIGPGGAPCPSYPAYQPYAPAPPPTMPYYTVQPRYARDPDRTAALIGSAIGFGVGGAVAGIMYLANYSDERSSCDRYVSYSDGSYGRDTSGCNGGSSRGSLITYGAIVTFLPSLPRFVVGDSSKGLIYTGLRGAAFATAALVDWGEKSDQRWQGPFLLGFVAPVTLGIIDLATTPHREDLVEKAAKPGISGIAPVAVTDRRGKAHGAVLTLEGRF